MSHFETELDVPFIVYEILMVLMSLLVIGFVNDAVGSKLARTFRFGENGIRECQDAKILKSVEWWNVESVKTSTLQSGIIIRWSEGKMTVPASHIGFNDLLVTIALRVSESRQMGIREMIDRPGVSQRMIALYEPRR